MDFLNIIQTYGIIKKIDCLKFDIEDEDHHCEFEVKWDRNSNQQDMSIFLPDRKKIFIKKKQGITSIEYIITKEFVNRIRTLSDDYVYLECILENEIIASILTYILATAHINDKATTDRFVNIIKILKKWASETYESNRICFAIGCDAGSQVPTCQATSFLDARDEKLLKVMSNGVHTMVTCNYDADITGIIDLTRLHISGTNSNGTKYYPIIFSDIAVWTNGNKFAFVLTRQGEILIFHDGSLFSAYRHGEWHIVYPNPLSYLILNPHECLPEVRKSILETCLDVSFNRHGACIGVVPKDDGLPQVVMLDDNIINNHDAINKKLLLSFINGQPFQSISRYVRQELASIDGALVLDGNGKIHAVGAILDNGQSRQRQGGGAREVAAQALAEYGCGIKTSSDGKIEAWGRESGGNGIKPLFGLC